MRSLLRFLFISFILISNPVLSSSICSGHDCEDCWKSYRPSGDGGTGKWKDNITPKRHWKYVEIEDREQDTHICDMCEKESVRYVHVMSHSKCNKSFEVGCICAGWLSGNLPLIEEREKDLKNRLTRRGRWLSRKWKQSDYGNDYLQTKGYMINISRSKNAPYVYGAKVSKKEMDSNTFQEEYNEKTFLKWYSTQDQAKLAAFDYIYPKKITIN